MDETPAYAQLNEDELEQIESEFGHPLSAELALWFIRNRSNREAVERMLRAAHSPQHSPEGALEHMPCAVNSSAQRSDARAPRRKTIDIRSARKNHIRRQRKCA